MKLRSNVCNRCLLVCVKFYLNRSRFAAVVAKCQGAHFFGTHGTTTTRTCVVVDVVELVVQHQRGLVEDGGAPEVVQEEVDGGERGQRMRVEPEQGAAPVQRAAARRQLEVRQRALVRHHRAIYARAHAQTDGQRENIRPSRKPVQYSISSRLIVPTDTVGFTSFY